MKKLFIAGLVLCAVGLGLWVLGFSPPPSHDADYYVAERLGSPFLAPLRHVKTLLLSIPTFGEGSCIVAYSATAEDFEVLQAARPWRIEPGPSDPSMLGRFFLSVWPGAPSDFDTYYLELPEHYYVAMVVSTDHTRIILELEI